MGDNSDNFWSDSSNYGQDSFFDDAPETYDYYERPNLFKFPLGIKFEFNQMDAFDNFDKLQQRLIQDVPADYSAIFGGDPDDRYAEEYETDPLLNLITRFQYTMANLGSNSDETTITTTESPFRFNTPHVRFILMWNGDKKDYEGVYDDTGIDGDFDETIEKSDLDGIWRLQDSLGDFDKLSDYEDYRDQLNSSDFMIAHYPLHYILVVMGFSIMIALLFTVRRRQIFLARQRALERRDTRNADVTIVIDHKSPEIGKSDAPPAYNEAIKLSPEKQEDSQMLPKYNDL